MIKFVIKNGKTNNIGNHYVVSLFPFIESRFRWLVETPPHNPVSNQKKYYI